MLFRELIHEPLTACDEIPTDNLPEQRANLRRTLKSWPRLPKLFKLVVTSRSEADFEQLFSTIDHIPLEIEAGESANAHSLEDIRRFLEDQCRQIADEYPNEIPADWPGFQIIQELTFKSGGLFIWAKIIIGFLNHGEPQEQLSRILSGTGAGGLATLYSWILKAAFPHPSEKVINAFRSLVGTIIVAKDPLPTSSIMALCSIDASTMKYICNGLQSVLTSGDVPRFKHQSIADFLIDPMHCPPVFFINRDHWNQKLTLECLLLMKRHLKFNICDIESSYYRNNDIEGLPSKIKERIPPHVTYACCLWTNHLTRCQFNLEIYELVCEFMQTRFLFWLEVISLTKSVSLASSIMQLLINWLQISGRDHRIASDMKKFVSMFGSVISQSVPHIYLSALPFSPQRSLVLSEYGRRYPQMIRILTGGQNDWPAIQKVLIGHTGSVTSVGFSPDGKRIVSGSSDWTIRAWDTETGEVVSGPFKGHTDYVTSIGYSPDGNRIVSGSRDMTIRLWNVETGEVVAGPFEGHTNSVTSVAFSPDGERLVSGSEDMTIRVWDTKTSEVVAEPFKGHTDYVISVQFLPDGKRIISGSRDRTVRTWDSETGEVVAGPFKCQTGLLTFVAFSPDGKYFSASSYNEMIRLWNAETGGVVPRSFKGRIGWVNSVAFSTDGKRLVSVSRDMTIQAWDTETGEVIAGPFEDHTHFITTVQFSPHGDRIVSGSQDKTIRIWATETSETVVRMFENHLRCFTYVAFSPDGNRLVSASGGMTFRVWNTETGNIVSGPFEGHTDYVTSVGFSPGGRHVVSGSYDRSIRVWDAETSNVVAGPFGGHTKHIDSVQFSPDGKWIISGSGDGTIRVWDAETGEVVAGPFKDRANSTISVTFSPNGNHFVSGSDDGMLRLWDVETGEVVARPFEGHTSWVSFVAFSPDGKRVVSGSGDNAILVWDAETGEVVAGPFEGHTSGINFVSFSSDGSRIFSCSFNKTIRVWDLTSPQDYASDLPLFTDSSKLVDGWILGPNSELLFWVPPDLQTGLWRPRNTKIIGKCIKTQLDFTRFVHGQSWSRCKDALPELA